MARKESITKDALLTAAFALLQEEGSLQVTARKLAAKAGCSTNGAVIADHKMGTCRCFSRHSQIFKIASVLLCTGSWICGIVHKDIFNLFQLCLWS